MIGVQVGEDHGPDVGRLDAERAQLGCDLVFGGQLEAGKAEERVPPREPARFRRTGGLAGVEEDETLWMLDHERVDGNGLRAPVVGDVVPDSATARLLAHDAGRQRAQAYRR